MRIRTRSKGGRRKDYGYPGPPLILLVQGLLGERAPASSITFSEKKGGGTEYSGPSFFLAPGRTAKNWLRSPG